MLPAIRTREGKAKAPSLPQGFILHGETVSNADTDRGFRRRKGLEPSCAHIWTPRPWRKPCAGFWPRRAIEIAHSKALEIVARQFGLDTWNILSARIEAATHGTTGSAGAPQAAETGLRLEGAAPIFRIFDVAKAREYYLGFLSMKLDWEHRFAPDLPL